MKHSSIISLFLVFAQIAVAQNSNIFRGRVYDSSDNSPMSYANISISSTGTGVVSNDYGEFVYHVPKNDKNDLIQISFIGYETEFVATDTINPNTLYFIHLQPKVLEIGEVNIIAEKLIPAERMVRRAIRKISDNYPKKPFQLYGYYRDYMQDINITNYKNLTEAAVIIEDNGFNTNDYKKTKVKLEQIRYNPAIAADTALNIGYDGTVKYVPNAEISGSNDLALLLYHNPIRNHNINTFSFVDVLDNTFIGNHEFNYESIIKNDTVKIYEIHFNTDTLIGFKEDSKYFAEGIMHIKSDDLAIIKFNYKVYCEMPSYDGKLFELELEFKDYADKYYLSYISMDNYFEFRYQNFGMYRPKIEHYFQYRQLFINKIVTEIDQPVEKEEAIEKGKILIANKVPDVPGFWDHYNIIINEKLSEEE